MIMFVVCDEGMKVHKIFNFSSWPNELLCFIDIKSLRLVSNLKVFRSPKIKCLPSNFWLLLHLQVKFQYL